jgi:hypothetical protein
MCRKLIILGGKILFWFQEPYLFHSDVSGFIVTVQVASVTTFYMPTNNLSHISSTQISKLNLLTPTNMRSF